MKKLSCLSLIVAALVSACGGGGSSDSPVNDAVAQTAPQPVIGELHFILRPDTNGRWFIEQDEGHVPIGVVPQITQTADHLRVAFVHSWRYAGTIQITSDDGFGERVSGHANLGTVATEIQIWADGHQIDPAQVWHYAPDPGNGNLWVNVTMVD